MVDAVLLCFESQSLQIAAERLRQGSSYSFLTNLLCLHGGLQLAVGKSHWNYYIKLRFEYWDLHETSCFSDTDGRSIAELRRVEKRWTEMRVVEKSWQEVRSREKS